MEALGSERIDRNLVAARDAGVPVVEFDARRETRHIFQTPLLLVARGVTLGAGERLTWTVTCAFETAAPRCTAPAPWPGPGR